MFYVVVYMIVGGKKVNCPRVLITGNTHHNLKELVACFPNQNEWYLGKKCLKLLLTNRVSIAEKVQEMLHVKCFKMCRI